MKPGRFGAFLPHSGNKSTIRGNASVGGGVVLALLFAAWTAAPTSAAAAGPEPQPYGAHDAGGFRNVLPPGQGHNANLGDIAAFESNGTMPANSQDQLD